jgi:hypothetical protein
MMTARAPNAKPRRGEPGHRQKLTILYGVLSFLSNTAGAVFWFAEQRRWKIADLLEELELR